MQIAEVSRALETVEEKTTVASVKKILRAYEQVFTDDVDILTVLGDIEQFFSRMQDRYENAFTIRNILLGQQKLLDMPIVRERLSESQYKHLQEVTKVKASAFTKSANDKQRAKTRVEVLEDVPGIEDLHDDDDIVTSVNHDVTSINHDASDEVSRLERKTEEQSRQIDDLNGTVLKLKSFISAVRTVLDLIV